MIAALILATVVALAGADSPFIPEGAARTGALYVRPGETGVRGYRSYSMNSAGVGMYLESDAADPTGFARLENYSFPIIQEDGGVRSVFIREIKARFMYVGGTRANMMDKRLAELGQQGRDVCLVRARWFGLYAFYWTEEGILMATPIDSTSAQQLDLEPSGESSYPVVEFQKLAPAFKQRIKEFRGNMPTPRFGHENHDHD